MINTLIIFNSLALACTKQSPKAYGVLTAVQEVCVFFLVFWSFCARDSLAFCSMSLVLVNRLFLSLRHTDIAGARTGSSVQSLTMPAFATGSHEHPILGNIGAFLRDGTENHEDCDDEFQVSSQVQDEK